MSKSATCCGFNYFEQSPLTQRIRKLGERLDSHRKQQQEQEQHPGLTLAGIYNVLEKLRSGEPLNAKEKQIHDQGLVTVLKQIHDELDDAVLEAYGWQDCSGDHRSPLMDGSSEEDSRRPVIAATLLTRLVALNHERAAEEKHGLIRWLRPDYQNPTAAKAPAEEQPILAGTESASSLKTENSQLATPVWPDRLPDQVISGLLLKGQPAQSQEGIDIEQLSTELISTAESTGLSACPRCGRFTSCLYGPEQPYHLKGRCRWCLDAKGPAISVTFNAEQIKAMFDTAAKQSEMGQPPSI